MYRVVETDGPKELFGHRTPVMTLADEYGGRCQIVVDDKCYMLMLQRDGSYFSTDHIFPEAFEALKTLPRPDSLHAGDPCIHCGAAHDDVGVGPCPGRG